MHLFPDLLEEHPAIRQASNTPKEESVVGPLGFEPRTDGLKVSGSSFKTAPKQPQKTEKLQGNSSKQQESGRFQATSQIQNGDNGDT